MTQARHAVPAALALLHLLKYGVPHRRRSLISALTPIYSIWFALLE